MAVYLEWVQILSLIFASMALFAWLVTGRNQNWLFFLGNAFAGVTVAIFMLRPLIAQ